MSGSAGLASARKRRAGGPTTISAPVKELPERNAPNITPMDPLALLLKHNELLKKAFQEIATLKGNTEKPEPENKESIEFFKQQYTNVLEEVKEIKKTLLKIQTFSMETNLEVMKLKRVSPDTEEHKIE
jgi:hypothetical protein